MVHEVPELMLIYIVKKIKLKTKSCIKGGRKMYTPTKEMRKEENNHMKKDNVCI